MRRFYCEQVSGETGESAFRFRFLHKNISFVYEGCPQSLVFRCAQQQFYEILLFQ